MSFEFFSLSYCSACVLATYTVIQFVKAYILINYFCAACMDLLSVVGEIKFFLPHSHNLIL